MAKNLFGKDKLLIGMIHLQPLPGVPGHPGISPLVDGALRDAHALLEGGADALLIENMHDFPCLREKEMGPEVAAAMTRAATEVRARAGAEVPMGVQVLFAAHRTALAIAAAAQLDFIRAEAWTYGHLSDKGWVEASAGTSVRYRKTIDADQVLVFADAKKKHASHAATADLSLAQIASGLELHRADGVIVTGSTTGEAARESDLRDVRGATQLPLIIGSGVTAGNVKRFEGLWDAIIVGTSVKEDGDWRRPVDQGRVEALVAAAKGAP